MAWLRARYRLRVLPGVLARSGYLAGDDERRRSELLTFLKSEDVGAVVAARGGYGCMRLLEGLPWEKIAKAPWIVGFSDVTALHASLWSRGIPSIHGPHVTGLAETHPRNRAAWLAALERPRAPWVWSHLEVIHPGATVRGPVLGGNLALLEAMAASGRLSVPPGTILALEDVTEKPYRIDRMLTALRLGGYLSRLSAIVLGGFEQCGPGPDGITVEEVLFERTANLGIPVLARAPFGHGDENHAFVLGAVAEVCGDSVRLCVAG